VNQKKKFILFLKSPRILISSFHATTRSNFNMILFLESLAISQGVSYAFVVYLSSTYDSHFCSFSIMNTSMSTFMMSLDHTNELILHFAIDSLDRTLTSTCSSHTVLFINETRTFTLPTVLILVQPEQLFEQLLSL